MQGFLNSDFVFRLKCTLGNKVKCMIMSWIKLLGNLLLRIPVNGWLEECVCKPFSEQL